LVETGETPIFARGKDCSHGILVDFVTRG